MELIDRDALMEEAHWIIRSDGTRVYAVHAEDVENAPVVDAVPVRHGKWLDKTKTKIKSFKNTNIPVVECTECGIDFCDIINNHQFMYHFCPNCGADMREVGHGFD